MYEDYNDYKEAISCTGLVVFGSIKYVPLCEILRTTYDTNACPVTNNVFNPCKRVDWVNLSSIIDKLKLKAANYNGIDKETIDVNIKLLEHSDKSLTFYNWSNQFGTTFDTLCEKLDLKVAGRKINRNNIREEWSYEKNMAFWAGVVEKGRPLVLCSPYHHYSEASNTTIHEMLWLYDNGYTFEPMMTGAPHLDYMDQIKIIAVPPSSTLDRVEVKIINYLKEQTADEILKLFNNKIVLSLREKIYVSNSELRLYEINKIYQDMYNDFVNKFNSYFSSIYTTEHQDLDIGTSDVLQQSEIRTNPDPPSSSTAKRDRSRSPEKLESPPKAPKPKPKN